LLMIEDEKEYIDHVLENLVDISHKGNKSSLKTKKFICTRYHDLQKVVSNV